MYTLRAGARSGGVLLIERKRKKRPNNKHLQGASVTTKEKKEEKRKKRNMPLTRVCSESGESYIIPGICYCRPRHLLSSLCCHLLALRCRPRVVVRRPCVVV
jgi:hypothetical protein